MILVSVSTQLNRIIGFTAKNSNVGIFSLFIFEI